MNERLRRGIGLILSFLSWLFGVLFVLSGVILLFSPMWSSGLFFIIMGAVLLPPVTKLVRNRFNFRLSAKVKTIVFLVCFTLAVITSPKTEQPKVAEPSPSPSPVQTAVESPPSPSPVQTAVESPPSPSPVQRAVERSPSPFPQRVVERSPSPSPVQRAVRPSPSPASEKKAVAPAPKPAPTQKAVTPSPSPSPTQAANLPACVNSDCDCKDFASQAEAQRVFDAYPGDPHRLDRDKDGIACENK